MLKEENATDSALNEGESNTEINQVFTVGMLLFK